MTGVAGAALITNAGIPRLAFAQEKVVKIGFLAPLTGAVAAWGKPGLDGCQIWADWMNEAGGIEIGGEAHKVEFIAYDEEYDAGKARTGATKLIQEDGVKFIMMLGGDPWPGVEAIAEREGMLVSTLLPSDLTPETNDARRALRGASDLQRHRRRVAGGKAGRAEDGHHLRAGRRARQAVGRDLSRGIRGGRHRGGRASPCSSIRRPPTSRR